MKLTFTKNKKNIANSIQIQGFILLFISWIIIGNVHILAQSVSKEADEYYKKEAVQTIQSYYNSVNQYCFSKIAGEESSLERKNLTEWFFESYKVYVLNDLYPEFATNNSTPRVVTIENYLNLLEELYLENNNPFDFTTSQSNVTLYVLKHQKTLDCLIAKVEVNRKLKGMFKNKFDVDETRIINFYVKIPLQHSKKGNNKILYIDEGNGGIPIDKLVSN